MIRKIWKFWPLGTILVLGFIFRTIKLEQLFYFTYDESIPAFVGRRLILWGHIPLIGGVTPFNFHLGPYFYWLYAAILFIGKLDPIAWGWASAAIAIVTTLMMYFVGKTYFSKKVGITASIFWATSYLANVYDRHLWALYWGPLLSLIVLFSLDKIAKGRQKFILLLALTVGLGTHADPSNLVFLLLAIIFWFVYKIQLKRTVFFGILVILAFFIPLIVFDLKHNFSNSRPVLDFIKAGRNEPGFEIGKFIQNTLLFPRTASRLVYTPGDSELAKNYSYCRVFITEKYQAIPPVVLLIISLLMIYFLWQSARLKIQARVLSYLVILYFVGIQIYGTIFRADIFEHYLTGLFPTFLLIVAYFVGKLPQKLWLSALAIFLIFNLQKTLNAKNSMGLVYKEQAIKFVMDEVGNRPFSLDSLSTCWKYSGYRYLFAVFGREPTKSYVDPNFAYLYGTTPVAEKHPQTIVAFVIHDFVSETGAFYARYGLLKAHEIQSALFGNIEVIIMENSTAWFD